MQWLYLDLPPSVSTFRRRLLKSAWFLWAAFQLVLAIGLAAMLANILTRGESSMRDFFRWLGVGAAAANALLPPFALACIWIDRRISRSAFRLFCLITGMAILMILFHPA